MRPNPIPLITICLLLSFSALTQEDTRYRLLLNSGSFVPARNITPDMVAQFNRQATVGAMHFAILQFEQIPTEASKQLLKVSGIELLDYIPHNAYTVFITGGLNDRLLAQVKARALVELTPEQKMQPALAKGNFPAHAVKAAGTVDVWINYPASVSFEKISAELRNRNFDIVSTEYKAYQVIALRINTHRVSELASLPFVEYVQAAPGEDKLLNMFSRIVGRSNILSKPVAAGGRNLRGEGVVIGIGDNADPTHVDFSNRLISRSYAPANFHGTHVHGTAGGGGIWNELYEGHASRSTLLSQVFTGVWANAPAYFTDHGMVITNNSYGNETLDCDYSGGYDNYSRILDQLSINLPKITHLFSAGNSGIGFPLNCSPYPAGFKSVLGGYQSAKNVITVGNAYADGVIFPQSSRGPVRDGRIKPEIVAQGAFVISTGTFTDYFQNTGTSMSSPAVAGALALLYQRYRQLNGPLTNPDNALMKALICNTATDRGVAGPDYSYGFGLMNSLRAVEALEANQYVAGTISTGGDNTFDITVPANTAQLKVMLCWNDPAAAVVASQALVNDLDLRLTNTAPATFLPLILNSGAGAVQLPAVPGVDTINNMEQVVIMNPSGTYTVHVEGSAVPVSAPQSYYVVYDIVPISSLLTFPNGGEKLIPGEQVLLNWDSYGGPANTFNLEFSSDNGSSWAPIASNIAADIRFLLWNIPAVPTNQALVRLTKNGTGQISTSGAFTILGAPAVSLSAVQCEGYISVDWTTVTGATQYEIMKLQGTEMVSVAVVPNSINTYAIGGLSKDSAYWVTVRALNGSFAGRRDTAVTRQPNNGTCAGTISDNDLKIDAILSPATSGRRFTGTELGNSVPVTIRVKNLDDQAYSGPADVSYYINSVLQQTQSITLSVGALGTTDHTFSLQADLSAVNNYTIDVTVTRPGDPVAANNTLSKLFRQLDNPLITLPFTDNLDAAPVQSLNVTQMGLQGLDRYDFVNSSTLGRVRTFINSGMSFSGTRALTLDAERFNAGNTDSLTGTFNIDLTGYNPSTDEIRLDFRYKNHGQVSNAANKVWIRGSDAGAWKEAYDLFANQLPPDGSYKRSASIEVSDLLAAAPVQVFTPSFQVRWGQYGQYQAADNTGGAGYTFDDIRLYKVTDDLQLISIDAPDTLNCGLTANSTVTITVRNSTNTAIPSSPGVPVRFRVDGGAWVTENIPGIPANTAVPYSFSTGANLSTAGTRLLEVEVDYPSDTFFDNDTLSLQLVNAPVITSFPHLEDFEAGNGSWYTTGGRLSTWEYGTPAATKITRAASGSKAWKTRVNGNYSDNEFSYLYSPCYDVSAMTNPTLSFSLALDIEDCGGSLCDGAYVEYSIDGNTWARLGANGQGTNWYNKSYTNNHLWSVEIYARWHVATIPLSVTGVPFNQMSRMRFRFVMTSDMGLNKDGIAIDDIHVYDNTNGIYEGVTMGSPVTQNIPGGTGWIHFLSGGQLVASVNSPVQAMGSTDVQAFIHTGAVRVNSQQYYHNRNITIKPATINLTDSATVRFYFLDTETEALINATGCPGCFKPSMAYQLGVTKYSDVNDALENGTLADNNRDNYLFINASKTRIVPFDKGYYAEFKVRDFSEFWLSNGGFDNNQPLPLKLLSFTARKRDNRDVQVEWTTESELNVSRFEIEVARGNTEYQQNRFVKIGEISSQGNSAAEQRYQFTDIEINKTGVRYYRLKMVDQDGSFRYSSIRPVSFNDELTWQVFPNPSAGIFHFTYQAGQGEMLMVNVYDMNGKVVKQYRPVASGFIQKLLVDLQDPVFAGGMYLLETIQGEQRRTFRLVKQ